MITPFDFGRQKAAAVTVLFNTLTRYLATASSDHTVKIWNVDGFTLEKTLIGHQRWVWDCVFSVDGAYLITASSDTTAKLWSMTSGEEIKTYQGHHKATVCCALHDGAEPSPS